MIDPKKPSAGLFMYRRAERGVEVLLVHPGGPYNANKDAGAWSFPKGQADHGEEGERLLEVALREFKEETSFEPLGPYGYVGEVVRQRDKKRVAAWMFKGDADLAQFKSNTLVVEWPPHSGKKIEVPECDRAAFFTIAEAREKLAPYLLPLIDTLEQKLAELDK